MSHVVDFVDVSTAGLASSPVVGALAGLRANEARSTRMTFTFARQKSKLAGTIRGSFFVIKGRY